MTTVQGESGGVLDREFNSVTADNAKSGALSPPPPPNSPKQLS
jgi:hypothetical protein